MKHKMWSRLLSMALAVMMIASIVPNSAFAEAASEIVASSQAVTEMVEETEEVAQPEETTGEEPAEQPAGEPAPTAEPVAEPTAEPVTESEQPAAEPTQAPAETAVSSEQPSAEPSAAPEGTQTPEGTEAPEGTAVPSETPAASATPAPSESPVPSETPVPTETPLPSEEPAIDGQALLDELMAIEDDEAFLKAVSELTEEQTAALEALGEEALAEYTLRVEQIDLSKLLDELAAMDDDAFVAKFASLTEEEKTALNELNAEVYAELEAKYELLTYVSPVFSVSGTRPVPFLQVGPLVENAVMPMTLMSRSAPMLLNSGTGTSEAEGIEVNKTATENGDGTYTLNLEAYATGDLEIVTESKPTDIVLVLDQSGSMADPFDYEYETEYVQYTGSYWESYQRPVYHICADGQPHELEVSREWKLRGYRYVYSCNTPGCSFGSHGNQCFLWGIVQFPSTDKNWGHLILEKKTNSIEKDKIDALREAVTTFINGVRQDANENNVDHRIAVVGFASDRGYGYNTEILSIEGENSDYDPDGNRSEQLGIAYYDLSDTDYKNALRGYGDPIIDNSIKALAASGATRADLGMEMAQKILEQNADPDRNQVVILFTDGEPTSGNSFEDWVADGAISQANAIKNSDATVYTIGIFNGADVNGSDRSNRYMQYVSSNYPNATAMDNPNAGNDTDGYYLVADDAEALTDIFEQISHEVGGTSSTLDEHAVLQDVVSPYFEIAENEDGTPKIKVFTAQCIGKTGDEFEFAEPQEVTNGSIQATLSPEDEKTVQVTGFDYKDNAVGTYTDANGTRYIGQKLMVQITVERADGFLGGNNVPTNIQNESGIYQNEHETSPVVTFPYPTVDVPLQYEVEENDKTIYLTNSENLLNLLNADAYNTSLGSDKYGNDYVKITYTFTADGETSTYTIDKSSATGVWTGELADETGMVKPGECKAYQVSVKVEPTSTKVNGVNSINKPLNPELHVVAPTIVWKDSFADYNETIGDSYYEENNLVSKDNIQWSNHVSDKTCTKVPTVSGNMPALDYEYTAKDANGAAIGAQLTAEAFVKVTVKAGTDKEDITAKTNFDWHADGSCVECTDPNEDPNADYQFRIHLKTGTLTIKKQLNSWNDQKGQTATFLFEISDGASGIYYASVTFEKTEWNESDDKVETVTIANLPAGTYTVTELGYPSGYSVVGDSVKTCMVQGTTGEVLFENNKNTTDDPARDDSVAVNNFTHDESGWVWNWVNKPA